MGGGRPSADQGQRGGDRPTDPVMTADGNLDFKVSAAEFERRTAEEFARLDGDDDHRLGLDEINRDCPSRPAGQPRP